MKFEIYSSFDTAGKPEGSSGVFSVLRHCSVLRAFKIVKCWKADSHLVRMVSHSGTSVHGFYGIMVIIQDCCCNRT